jgi:hypothetical protein
MKNGVVHRVIHKKGPVIHIFLHTAVWNGQEKKDVDNSVDNMWTRCG